MKGPRAPWLDEEQSVYPFVIRRTADLLIRKLEQRQALLQQEDPPIEVVLAEIRRHIASCAIDDPIMAADLADLMLELVYAQENRTRL